MDEKLPEEVGQMFLEKYKELQEMVNVVGALELEIDQLETRVIELKEMKNQTKIEYFKKNIEFMDLGEKHGLRTKNLKIETDKDGNITTEIID